MTAAGDVAAMPLEVVRLVMLSVARNVVAEWPFYATIAVALVIAIVADALERRDVIRKWTSKPVRTDALYAVTELSHLHAVILLIPAAAALTGPVLEQAPWLKVEALAALPLWAQALVLLVIGDFAQYWMHRFQHANRWLWQFHKVHHSQRELTVLTHFRFPILDRLASTVMLLPLGFISGSATLPVVLLIFKLLRSALEHSGLPWTYGPVGRIIVSPSFHSVHHSAAPEHMDRNFGGVFAFWDHLFGTYAPRGDKSLEYGLIHEDVPECYVRQHWVPLVGIWRLATGRTPPGPKGSAAPVTPAAHPVEELAA